MNKHLLPAIGLSAIFFVSGCSHFQVAREVHAGRNALQSGRPSDAVAYLMRAAEQDPGYAVSHRIPGGVLAYLGRAYYESGSDMEARSVLEKALARDTDDHVARLYLGLSLARSEGLERGRMDLERSLRGIHGWLEQLAEDRQSGIFFDPTRQIRSAVDQALNGKLNSPELLTSARQIGVQLDEEIDNARRDESRSRYNRGGGDN